MAYQKWLQVIAVLVSMFTFVYSHVFNEFCLHPVDVGTCARNGGDFFARYFFNSTSKRCELFYYSGCEDKIVCERVCETNFGYTESNNITVYPIPRVDYDDSDGSDYIKQISLSKMAEILCKNGVPFRLPLTVNDTQQCSSRRPCEEGYTCVKGPKNYHEMFICCSTYPITTTTIPTTTTHHHLTPPIRMHPESCLLPPDYGRCRHATKAWYFDIDSQECKQFVYGGCGGNANRFLQKDECNMLCKSVVVNLGITPKPEVTIRRCHMPPDSGGGQRKNIKFYYELAVGKCLPFLFGNCGGNGNNFDSEEQCMNFCYNDGNVNEKDRVIHYVPETIPCKSENESSSPTPPSSGTQNVNWFQHPDKGYSSCTSPVYCSQDPCQSARCPAYEDAICLMNPCDGCLAEFYMDNKRVNCSITTKPDLISKPGQCVKTLMTSPCPKEVRSKFQPQNNLCSTDAECFGEKKCCPEVCSERSFMTCQQPAST